MEADWEVEVGGGAAVIEALWEGFVDHPMRRDYVEPDDFEYEPTPHDEVLKRAEQHRALVAARSETEANG